MEQDGVPEALAAAEAAGGALDALDIRVDRLTGGVGRLEGHRVHDASEVLLDHARDLSDGDAVSAMIGSNCTGSVIPLHSAGSASPAAPAPAGRGRSTSDR